LGVLAAGHHDTAAVLLRTVMVRLERRFVERLGEWLAARRSMDGAAP